ncbi:piwi-like protein 1 [Mytilus galloprovincialis]|uniref:piwi-like protein 1 n=1 Tax=Mytilus galloprovincialis TaxID=29158 RepID=UPI003F7BC851
MSGRARGRSRGRARNDEPDEPARRPGDSQPTFGENQLTTPRGRGRGAYRNESQPARMPNIEHAASQLQQMRIDNTSNQSRRGNDDVKPHMFSSDDNRPIEQGDGFRETGARPKEWLMAGGRTNPEIYQQQGTRAKFFQGNKGAESGYQEQGNRPRGSNYQGNIQHENRQTSVVRKAVGLGSTNIHIIANAFPVECTLTEWILYQYHVDFNPQVDSKKVRCAMIADHKDLLGETRAFDGMKLIIPRRLPQEVTEVYSEMRSDGTRIRITISMTNEIPPVSAESIHIFNIILKRAQRMLGGEQIGRNYYNQNLRKTNTAYRMDIIPGFLAAIQKFEAGNLLLIDVAHKLLQTDSILTQMTNLYHLYKDQHDGDNKFWDRCRKQFIGTIVLTRYNNKTYLIDDIDSDKTPLDTFELRNGEKISYADYYRKQYNITDLDETQPMLISRPKEKDKRVGRTGLIILLPQLCYVTGMTNEIQNDRSAKTSIQTLTRVAPQQRVVSLTEFVQQIQTNKDVQKMMNDWHLRIPTQALEIQAKLLDPEIIKQKDVQLRYDQTKPDWSKDMRSNLLTTAVSLKNWVIIFSRKNRGTVVDFIEALKRVGPPMGINFTQPIVVELPDDRNLSYITGLRQTVESTTQLVLCVLPHSKEDCYNAIKKFCCVDHPVPSQVVLSRTIFKKQNLQSVSTNIAIQLNCKLGGELWVASMPGMTTGLMIVGIDVFHDKKNNKSYAGVVCSLNKECTRYFSTVTPQLSGQELIDGIYVKFAEGLKKYHQVNGHLPGNIVVYRDGVGDGQLDMVMEHEVKQMQGCTVDLYPDVPPKMAVVIVKKRISQRFFSKNHQNYSNPTPGTVVDSALTKSEWMDFFLVSQSVRQGTVSPTHYNVIYNTITSFTADRFQRLTYKLCHLYYNWPGTIRVPAPCQYAHKLAYLVGQNIRKIPHPALSDRLYFL